MKNFKNTSGIAGQSSTNLASPKIKGDKHDANLQKNSTLYFQVGLIVCLLTTYGLLEMQFEKTLPSMDVGVIIEDSTPFHMDDFVIQDETPKNEPVKRQVQVISTLEPIVKENDEAILETELLTPEQLTTDVPAKVGDIVVIDEPEIIDEVFSMIGVEKVPIYPGCESAKTNAERKQCMSEKLALLIQKRFDKDLASELGLSGIQRINVQFKIDTFGNVTDIKARAPRRELEKEAKRVTEKIPQMIPGKQRDKAVSVMYNLPIIFDVKN
uniref:energy transducer TonB n=3 Tax=Gelidibacter sp. TaxID=2018083 RepID=UPI00404A2F5A